MLILASALDKLHSPQMFAIKELCILMLVPVTSEYACLPAGTSADVHELKWGASVSALTPPFDVVVACDVMYMHDAVEPLVQTLQDLTAQGSSIYIAHGRNQQARDLFLHRCKGAFQVAAVPEGTLDELYRCEDVEVLLLTPLGLTPMHMASAHIII